MSQAAGCSPAGKRLENTFETCFWESLGAIDNDKRCHSLFSQRHCAAQGMNAVSRAGSVLSRKGPHLQPVNSTGEASALTLGTHS